MTCAPEDLSRLHVSTECLMRQLGVAKVQLVELI